MSSFPPRVIQTLVAFSVELLLSFPPRVIQTMVAFSVELLSSLPSQSNQNTGNILRRVTVIPSLHRCTAHVREEKFALLFLIVI